jgi:hypothetical protein
MCSSSDIQPYMQNERDLGRERTERLSGHFNAWHSAPRSDARGSQGRSAMDKRERISVSAFVKGRRWYAKRLLNVQPFPNTREASRALIQNSQRLIEESRVAITKTKNLLAFSRDPQKFVN